MAEGLAGPGGEHPSGPGCAYSARGGGGPRQPRRGSIPQARVSTWGTARRDRPVRGLASPGGGILGPGETRGRVANPRFLPQPQRGEILQPRVSTRGMMRCGDTRSPFHNHRCSVGATSRPRPHSLVTVSSRFRSTRATAVQAASSAGSAPSATRRERLVPAAGDAGGVELAGAEAGELVVVGRPRSGTAPRGAGARPRQRRKASADPRLGGRPRAPRRIRGGPALGGLDEHGVVEHGQRLERRVRPLAADAGRCPRSARRS